MLDAHTVVALPVSGGVRFRTSRAPNLRNPARMVPTHVLPMFTARPHLRERSQAGLGIAIAFGFSALCWAGLAAAIL